MSNDLWAKQLIRSVYLSPLYLILLFIHRPRTSFIRCSVDSVSKPIPNRYKEKKRKKPA